MKQFIISIFMVITIAFCSTAQTAYSKAEDGTLVQEQVIKTFDEVVGTAEKTDQQFRATNGKTYPVYKNSKGRLFIVRESKAGNNYRVYLEEKKE